MRFTWGAFGVLCVYLGLQLSGAVDLAAVAWVTGGTAIVAAYLGDRLLKRVRGSAATPTAEPMPVQVPAQVRRGDEDRTVRR